jgi:hypothetical protein
MITLDALRAFGADVDDGLRRCMNMESFYLGLFAALKGDRHVEDLKEAIAAKDLDRAFELAEEVLFSGHYKDSKRLFEIIAELKSKLQKMLDQY